MIGIIKDIDKSMKVKLAKAKDNITDSKIAEIYNIVPSLLENIKRIIAIIISREATASPYSCG
ncbi:MAG: hypothetical protein K5986_10785 [Clostridium sp.]|uniref:hypothetical protein n=1 Tax=Clostridium sp. DSM 8431 TaxID=1761781 RepID=UPI000B7D3E7B|nr:hypothetical protein [Clostridium sp. DSM 8431]MCR4944898.1 hypothetical protein [Clostridium sp.]